MTQDEIIEMYLQVSKKLCNDTEWCWAGVGEPLQMFAKLVADKAIAELESQESNPIKDGWKLSVANGHSGYGVYAHMDDYPEEGAFLLLPIKEALAQPKPVAELIYRSEGSAGPPRRFEAQQEQEPVAIVTGDAWETDIRFLPEGMALPPDTKLYTHPQRTWVGLTDEDWKEIEDMPDTFDQGVAWAQRRLREKNT